MKPKFLVILFVILIILNAFISVKNKQEIIQTEVNNEIIEMTSNVNNVYYQELDSLRHIVEDSSFVSSDTLYVEITNFPKSLSIKSSELNKLAVLIAKNLEAKKENKDSSSSSKNDDVVIINNTKKGLFRRRIVSDTTTIKQ